MSQGIEACVVTVIIVGQQIIIAVFKNVEIPKMSSPHKSNTWKFSNTHRTQ